MPELVVGVQELIDGEWWLYVETAADVVGCPDCGCRAIGHGRTRSAVRDLAVAGRPTVLWFARRRWRCPDSDCEVNTWSEHVGAIAARASLSERARARLAEVVNVEGWTIAGAAVEFGVGWHTANHAVAEFADPVIDDPNRLEGVTAIGVDEKRLTNARPGRSTTFTTQIVDLDERRLLDVVAGRSGVVLDDWLSERRTHWCAKITLATLDPAAGYRRALIDNLPNATLVVDHFHAIKLANKAIDDTRQGVQQTTTGHRGRKADPLYGARRLFLTGWERLSEDRIASMMDMLNTGDPEGEVGAASLAKELPREVYATLNITHARRRLIVFHQQCADANAPAAPPTDSPTTPTTADASSPATASNGLPSQHAESEVTNHAQSRRAGHRRDGRTDCALKAMDRRGRFARWVRCRSVRARTG
ncbi:MAG: ISL3 family transposase [Actinomycetia bacterium]|nr:ISL3 family transposase [Actinomycetes bacterium]